MALRAFHRLLGQPGFAEQGNVALPNGWVLNLQNIVARRSRITGVDPEHLPGLRPPLVFLSRFHVGNNQPQLSGEIVGYRVLGISNTLFHELAMYPPYAEEASAKKFLPPRCFTKFSPLKECDVLPADTDTRASGRAGSPALAKPHRVKHQAAWNRSTRRAGERGGARAGRPRCVRILT